MKIDWKKGPGYKQITKLEMPEFEVVALDNGIKTILVNQGSQDIFRADVVYKGARLLEHKKIASKFTSSLMREGTEKYTSAVLAETIDFFGATLRTGSNLDYTYFTLSGITRHFHSLLPYLAEVIYHPIFPETEIEKYKKTNIQKLLLDMSKNELLNYRIFTENLYGVDHPYGYNTDAPFIQDITREDLVYHHKTAYCTNNCFIMLGGKLSTPFIDTLNQTLGQLSFPGAIPEMPAIEIKDGHRRIMAGSKNEHQASIKIGRRLFNRHHPDFAGFYVLNTILGGYFGSRLMTSVREDLGLTYNIYSVMDQLIFDGYFYIETEVALDKVEETIAEIYNQMQLLCVEKVSPDELQMVKNYLMGNFLNLIDGPLSTLSFLRSLEMDNATIRDFGEFIQQILELTPEILLALAQQYFNKKDMLEVIVGGGFENNK
ncbi:MAG: insulinase family protein [Saprospiraceae bacterium]|nr:insulinase family protein [Saprospiraceae bacterium]